MRKAFIRTLAELAGSDPRIFLLTGDLGFLAVEEFSERFPDRFLNMGVAEQNMVGVATGLAEDGFLPFVYSISTFISMRPYEFIRNGPVHHHLPVRLVGIGGGFEYGNAGVTHFALEDLGLMRLQPGLTLIAPADQQQTKSALRATWDMPGPVYYRIGKDEATIVPGLGGRFELDRAQTVSEGEDLLMVTAGSIASEVVNAAEILRRSGITTRVVIISCLNPAPAEDLISALSEFDLAMTVESHYVTGGVGSLVAEIIAEQNLDCRLIRCGVSQMPDGVTGSQQYLEHRHGLSSEAIVEAALAAINTNARSREVVR
ncbi:MAG TPA: transketolase C-terminal domain-containing protein [Pyrinomonadaceae bacterium]|nr:transketolase C-terminal domain-containing protein [Pyrinomonadaceae bacterium]